MRRLLLSILLLPAASAHAQDGELLRCADIAGRDDRLACFDALATKARVAKATNTTPLALAEKFGHETVAPKPGKPPEVIDAVQSRIDGVVEGWSSGTIFTFANGQRWQIADGSAATIYVKSPKVTVKRAVLGGYVLELEGTNRTAKVKRVE